MNPAKPVSCDDNEPSMLSVEQAQARVLDLVKPVTESQTRPIREALNQVLAEDIVSPINVPGYANSAMDGYAVVANDLPEEQTAELRLIGTAYAGVPYAGSVKPGECVRIMTGAKMPDGADTVIMQEHIERDGDTIRVGSGHTARQNVRYPGEDIAAGNVVFKAGQVIGPAELGLLASLGIARVKTWRRLRVAFFSTGDELRSVGTPLAEGQIYDSNRYTLYGMLTKLGVEIIDMGVIRDDPIAIEVAFKDAAEQADAIITSGGVSVGEADYVKATLDKLGEVNFWRIAMKPGKPLAMGKVHQAMFFGLPGNPVSVMATFYLFVMPALRAMMGQLPTTPLTVTAISKHKLKKRPGRAEFQRGVLSNENGQLVVDAAGMQASHILSGMSQANCFIVLARDAGDVEAGSDVPVLPFHGLMS